MKVFVVFFIITFMFTIILFGAYDLKIGVYKNGINLQKTIAKIENREYRKNIIVDKKEELYYAHAIFIDKKKAENALGVYTKVFKDAFIAKEEIQLETKKIKKEEKKNTQPKSKQIKIEKPLESSITIDTKTLLQNKTVYLCYDKFPTYFKNRVVKMIFSKEYIEYMPLDNSTQLDIEYIFKDDKVILNLPDMNITHTINAITKEYLSASNSEKGKIVYTLRYYFDEQNALDFVAKNRVSHN